MADITNVFQTSFYPEEAKDRLASCLLKDRAYDWWEEVGRALGDAAVEAMTWNNFVIGFRVEFAPVIEV